MKHLIYYHNGLLKSFAINKPTSVLGRSANCDLRIDDGHVSGKHLEIIDNGENIKIIDLGSKNGTFINNIKITESEINIDESFFLADNHFILKKGNARDFEISDEVKEILNGIEKENKDNFIDKKTEYSKDILDYILKNIIKIGLQGASFSTVLMEITYMLNDLAWFGDLFIVNKKVKKVSILLSINKKGNLLKKINEIFKKHEIILEKEILLPEWKEKGELLYSKPLSLGNENFVLLYFGSLLAGNMLARRE